MASQPHRDWVPLDKTLHFSEPLFSYHVEWGSRLPHRVGVRVIWHHVCLGPWGPHSGMRCSLDSYVSRASVGQRPWLQRGPLPHTFQDSVMSSRSGTTASLCPAVMFCRPRLKGHPRVPQGSGVNFSHRCCFHCGNWP